MTVNSHFDIKKTGMSAPLLVLIDFSLTVKVKTFIFIPGRGSAIPSAKEGKSGKINTLLICFRAVQTCVHARIQEFLPGGGGPGPTARKQL